jgi:4-amino-4-deoxy-L-arabinose transferase-like glycosyltransferase
VNREPSSVNTRAITSIAAGAFIVRFLRLGAIENDHYVYLARAHQMLHGDWPVRDFVDAGFPLGYLLSAGAAAIAGPTLLTEASLSVGLFAIAVAATYALTRRAAGSIVIGLAVVTGVLLFPPRLYNSSKMLVPAVAMLLAWKYCDRPGRLSAVALGMWTAIAFLFRHDYGVYVAVATIAMMFVLHSRDWRVLVERAAACAIAAIVIASPWLIYVQLEQGLAGYLTAAIRFSSAEGARTVSHWALSYYGMAAVPIAALLVGVRGTRQLSSAQITFAAVLALLLDLVLLRDVPGSRLPDVYATTAVAGAIVIGALHPSPQRVGRAWARTLIAVPVLVVAAAAWIGMRQPATSFGMAWPTARWQQVTTRLREERPEIMPDPRRAPLVEYIRRCIAVDDRLLVGGFGPELPVLTQRAFAGGLPDWLRGYYEQPADVARARAQLAREHVGAAVMLDGGDAFTASWPAIAADLRTRGFVRHDLQLARGSVELWLPPMKNVDAMTGLPCAM